MMAAICAAEQGAEVTLLEPNERLGKKLNIAGKGRCNVTNNADLETLLANNPTQEWNVRSWLDQMSTTIATCDC